ncbi:uncharacterized protein LOC108680865 [Hyalella azteca]|uniref:Uncharacterized protein LOC108680865 n=1 Tax=Hyalella azteca TaxID=294128 RepID=A0A979FN92_HYAAZ|nr:uncharacterized protein LOC108680865 [Hyalella azteca]
MGDYFEEEMEEVQDTAGIVIDDYDGYDEEYFEEDAGTFGQESESSQTSAQQMPGPSERLAARLSVDSTHTSGVSASCDAGDAGNFQENNTKCAMETVTETETDEVEEIEEEEVEEEEEEEEEDKEEYERFNRTEVVDSRTSVLNRLGPRLSDAPASTTPAAAAAAPASAATGKNFPSSQSVGVFRRLILINNVPVSTTPQQMIDHVKSMLKGRVTLELFDGIYNGMCVVSLSIMNATRAVAANLSQNFFNSRKLLAKLMVASDMEMYVKNKLHHAPPGGDATDNNALWVVVMTGLNRDSNEDLLRAAVGKEVASLVNLQLVKKKKNKGSGMALLVAPNKLEADNLVNLFQNRSIDGSLVKMCPLYRGYKSSAPASPGAPLVCTRAPAAERPAAPPKPGPEARVWAVERAIKLNSLRELMQRSKGSACRVNVTNVAYSVTEDDMIEAVNSRVGGLQYILPFRNNQGCFNGNMLLEFVTPTAAKKFYAVMQKFNLKQRQIFLRMDTDAPRDLQGNVLPERGTPNSGSDMPYRNAAYDGPPQAPRPDMPVMGPPIDAPNYGLPHPPIHPMDRGPIGHEIPPFDYNDPAHTLIGARLEPMLHPVAAAAAALPVPPPIAFPDPANETYGLSPDYLNNLNIELPLVPKVLISNVDPRASENDVGDLLSVAGSVATVQINRHLQQAIVEMAHPVEAVEAISRLNRHPLYDQSIAVRLCRRRDFEMVNGLPITDDIPVPSGIGVHGAGVSPAFGQMHLNNPFPHSGFDPISEHSMPPMGGHNFRGPSDVPAGTMPHDDLRSSLSRPGFAGHRPGHSSGGVLHGDLHRSSPSTDMSLRNDVYDRALGRPLPYTNAHDRASNASNISGRTEEIHVPFGIGKQTSAAGRAPVNSSLANRDALATQSGRGLPNQQLTRCSETPPSGRGAGRGAANAPAGRGAANIPAGRGAANVPPGRGAANAPARKGAANIPAGKGAANIPAGRGVTNVPAGRGAANAPAGRGTANVPAGRGATNTTTAGRGAGNIYSRPGINGSAAAGPDADKIPTAQGITSDVPAGIGSTKTHPPCLRTRIEAPINMSSASSSVDSPAVKATFPNPAARVVSSMGSGTSINYTARVGTATDVGVGRGTKSDSSDDMKDKINRAFGKTENEISGSAFEGSGVSTPVESTNVASQPALSVSNTKTTNTASLPVETARSSQDFRGRMNYFSTREGFSITPSKNSLLKDNADQRIVNSTKNQIIDCVDPNQPFDGKASFGGKSDKIPGLGEINGNVVKNNDDLMREKNEPTNQNEAFGSKLAGFGKAKDDLTPSSVAIGLSSKATGASHTTNLSRDLNRKNPAAKEHFGIDHDSTTHEKAANKPLDESITSDDTLHTSGGVWRSGSAPNQSHETASKSRENTTVDQWKTGGSKRDLADNSNEASSADSTTRYAAHFRGCVENVWRSGSAPNQSHETASKSRENTTVDQWKTGGSKRDLADNSNEASSAGSNAKRMRNDYYGEPMDYQSGRTVDNYSSSSRDTDNPYLREKSRMDSANRVDPPSSSYGKPSTDETFRDPLAPEGHSSARTSIAPTSSFNHSKFETPERTVQKGSVNGISSYEHNRQADFETRGVATVIPRNIANAPLTVDYQHKSSIVPQISNSVSNPMAQSSNENPYLRGDSPIRDSGRNNSAQYSQWNSRGSGRYENSAKSFESRDVGRPAWNESITNLPQKAVTKDWHHGSDRDFSRPPNTYQNHSRYPQSGSTTAPSGPSYNYRQPYSSHTYASHSAGLGAEYQPRLPELHGPPVGASLGRTSLFSSSQSAKLVINNLPGHVNKRDISDLCSRFGVVRDIELDTRLFKSRVVFSSVHEAQMAAKELNDLVYRGSTLRALVA